MLGREPDGGAQAVTLSVEVEVGVALDVFLEDVGIGLGRVIRGGLQQATVWRQASGADACGRDLGQHS